MTRTSHQPWHYRHSKHRRYRRYHSDPRGFLRRL